MIFALENAKPHFLICYLGEEENALNTLDGITKILSALVYDFIVKILSPKTHAGERRFRL